jgi:adenosine kinase
MRLAITGSIATDHLMTFPGRFSEQLLAERLESISLSFLVDELVIRRGGVAANISFGLGRLGLRPILVGAVGADFDDYRSWLERHGVDCESVHVSDTAHTARFLCTTDIDANQLASFYAGAMSEAREIELGPIATRVGGLDLVVISPNDPEAMRRHTEECRQRGISFVADPSQQLARIDGDEIRRLVDGAKILFSNEYEAHLMESKTGWNEQELVERVGLWVVTRGSDGCVLRRSGVSDVAVPTVPEVHRADPTGVGDGFRAGFLAALAWGLDETRCAQVGSLVATYVLETVGTQEYTLDAGDFLRRFDTAFGSEAAADLAPHLEGLR